MYHQTKLAHNKGGLLELAKKCYYLRAVKKQAPACFFLLILDEANSQKIQELKLHVCFILFFNITAISILHLNIFYSCIV